MVKKKQFFTMTSIAVISFLIGTMFNLSFLAMSSDGTDDYGVPFDKIWEAIKDMNQTIEDLKTQIPDAKNTTKITISLEMQGISDLNIKFNGLSLEDVFAYSWNIINGTFSPYTPKITLNSIEVVTDTTWPPGPIYAQIEIPLNIFISNKTVSVYLHQGYQIMPPTPYTTLRIYNKHGTLVHLFSITYPVEYETLVIYAKDLLQ